MNAPASILRPTRRWKRSKIDVPVRLAFWNDSLHTISDARSHDISLGGAGVSASVELTPESIVEVEFIQMRNGPRAFSHKCGAIVVIAMVLFLNHLTARLFYPCRQEEHDTCEKKIAMYRCSAIATWPAVRL